MSRYNYLQNVLDALCLEAKGHKHESFYTRATSETLNQARSRAFIHLFLKVQFGLLTFSERERYITDGTYDGGIDGYFLEADSRTIFFIQSKFRTTETNFEEKELTLEELLRMDIDRISKGEDKDEHGNTYNGKILQLEREISQIPDVGRWKYQVIILANLKGYSTQQIQRLVSNLPVRVYDAEAAYDGLLFPILSGTYYNSPELRIQLDLSNKYAGTKISYTVATTVADCEITVVFVPVIEIARVMHKYKNSILRYNPRSYLELEGKKTNAAIRATILGTETNEFALLNNGITMLSDLTDINERVGLRNKAQLSVTNPQIINGGQTAYTLSKVFEELPEEQREQQFAKKRFC